MANPVGRPTDYRPEYCETALNYMRQGYSMTAAAGFMGFTRQTLDNWTKAHPDFFDAIKRGQAARTAFLEGGLLAGDTAGPQITARIFALKNAAPDEWRDKHEVEHSGGINVTISQDDADL